MIGAGVLGCAQRCVHIIDDDADVRKSLHFLLRASSITAWPYAEAADFIAHLPELAPAPILLDIRMPGIDGLQTLAILKDMGVTWPVIVMTAHGDVTIAVRAMKLGAIEFLEKPFQPEMLDHVLGLAFAQLDRIAEALRARDDARALVARLSPRESEIMSILIQGAPNKIAAFRLGLSTRTVEMHRSNALAKLNLRSLAEVVALVATAEMAGQPPWSNIVR